MSEVTDERQRRVAENQSLFREINEQLRQLNETFEQLTPYGTWTCECADLTCVDPIEVTLGEYEALREHPARFAIVPHADHFYGDVERIVQETEGDWVVEKSDTASKVAIQLSRPGGRESHG